MYIKKKESMFVTRKHTGSIAIEIEEPNDRLKLFYDMITYRNSIDNKVKLIRIVRDIQPIGLMAAVAFVEDAGSCNG